ncbi:MAG: hypothetical protein KDA61_07535, partial [Planctomycetales bacterium]|nr:hypothetical protein [Planctomycetales bacterium]
VVDRNYGGAEHDGFQDTFNVDVAANVAWGLESYARKIIANYLENYVCDDGSILYRGPETGQYGRMLTVLAEYYAATRDADTLLDLRARIDGIANLLRARRIESLELSPDDAGHGLIAGWCEADSCLEAAPARYDVPYLSNSSEAVRGFDEMGRVWEEIGREHALPERVEYGSALRREAAALEADLQRAIERTTLRESPHACLPVVAGAGEPYDVAIRADAADPQFRAYRANMELLYSGCLKREQVETIVRYRESHRDVLLGVPTAYGYNSGELAGFLSYGHAYGLLQHDMVRKYLLTLYSLSAHHYTRGSWTAPETRLVDPDRLPAPYCVPAQLVVPLTVRWMLAFDDPKTQELWLCKATPREWLQDGGVISATGVPTRRGRVSMRIESRWNEARIVATLTLPPTDRAERAVLVLRAPVERAISSVLVDGRPWTDFDATAGRIVLPGSLSGEIVVEANFRSGA